MTDLCDRFGDELAERHLTPLWEVMAGLITPQPKSACRAHLWRYDDVRPVLMDAGEMITAREAERRVLVLANPGLAETARITTSLYAGLQLVLPGEVAPAHRHTQSALRFVLEGSGGYTVVAGEKVAMARGDFIITPNWAWHDHGNEGDDPVVWLDGLDIPLVQFLDCSFAEKYPGEAHPVDTTAGIANARYAQAMLPVDTDPPGPVSPVFHYPYARARAALETLAGQGEFDPCHGVKLRYANPTSGEHAMATIATFLQLLPKRFTTAPYRSTDATVFVCVEGAGTSTIGGERFTWTESDVFVAPSWTPIVHKARGEAVLFSFSDRAVQEKLGLWREQRGNA